VPLHGQVNNARSEKPAGITLAFGSQRIGQDIGTSPI